MQILKNVENLFKSPCECESLPSALQRAKGPETRQSDKVYIPIDWLIVGEDLRRKMRRVQEDEGRVLNCASMC